MKIYLLIFFGLFLLIGQPILNAQDCLKLVWSDEFEGNDLDETKWNFDIGNGCPELCGWGNNEKQYYSDSKENVSVDNGILTITAKNDSLGGFSYSSGKIHTQHKGAFRYGRIDARIKLPETQALWPAFWMLPTEDYFGEWPRSGEIDILELLGHKPNEILGTVHTGLPWRFITEKYIIDSTASFADDFHTFSLEWNADTLQWFVDDNLYHTVTSDSLMPWEPFLKDFYLILNVAVGGNLSGFPDSTTMLPQSMEVDYIRVYNKPRDFQIIGNRPIAGAAGMKYRTFQVDGATYNWAVPSGSTISAGQGTNEITVDWGCTPGDILLELVTDCETADLIFAAGDFEDLKIEGATTVEENEKGLIYSVPDIAGGIFNWNLPADAVITSGQGTNEISVDWGCEEGEVIVSVTGDCATQNDTIFAGFKSLSIKGFSIVPANAVFQIYTIDKVPGATYIWSAPPGAVIFGGQGTNEIGINFGTSGGDIIVEVRTDCGTKTYVRSIEINTSALYCDFDGTDLDWDVFGGTTFEKIENPFPGGINTSDHVGKSRKERGAQNWGGIYADLGGEVDFTKHPLMHVKVFSTNTGVVKFKVEDQTGGVDPIELDVDLDVTGEWVDLIWDFTGTAPRTYDRFALFFDFGNIDTSYWYFDDVIGEDPTATNVKNISLQAVKIFPNPTKGEMTIELNGLFSEEDYFNLQILDSSGRLYLKEQFRQAEQINVSLQNLPSGTYFFRLLGNNTQYIKAVTKL